MSKGKRARAKIGKPNAILYFLVYILVYPFLKLVFRLKVDRGGCRPMPAGPFIVVSNHQSFMDFLLPTLTMYPRALNAVAAQKFFFYKPLNVLLPLMGCIPKFLFDPDPRSIIGMLSVIRRGGSRRGRPSAGIPVSGKDISECRPENIEWRWASQFLPLPVSLCS